MVVILTPCFNGGWNPRVFAKKTSPQKIPRNAQTNPPRAPRLREDDDETNKKNMVVRPGKRHKRNKGGEAIGRNDHMQNVFFFSTAHRRSWKMCVCFFLTFFFQNAFGISLKITEYLLSYDGPMTV